MALDCSICRLGVLYLLLKLGTFKDSSRLFHLSLRIFHSLLELRTIEDRRRLRHLPLRILHPLLELRIVEDHSSLSRASSARLYWDG